MKNTIVIGADTIVVRDEEILGKPKNEDHAYEILLSLREEHMKSIQVLQFFPIIMQARKKSLTMR